MQAITTKYLGPTNFKPGRIVARCEARRIVVSWDFALDVAANHREAAKELARRLDWHGDWRGGSLPTGGYAFICGASCSFSLSPRPAVKEIKI